MSSDSNAQSQRSDDAGDSYVPAAIEALVRSVGTRGAVEVIKSYISWGQGLLQQGVTDIEALGSAAHGLKPCAEVLGLTALTTFCRGIGVARRNGSALDMGVESVRMRTLLNEALSYLEIRLTHLQSSGSASAPADGTERP